MILSSHGIIGSQIVQATGLLIEYPGAAAAYSLRLLRSTYTGDAIRVRRSSDNTEQDIGFVSGELDTSSLLSFVGTGGTDNGFVKTWYDQSGNGYDATQTTAANQPQIVSAGSVILEGGKPTVQFDGSNDYLIQYGLSSLFSGNNMNFGIMDVSKTTKNALAFTSSWSFGNSTNSTPRLQFNTNNITLNSISFNAVSDANNSFVIYGGDLSSMGLMYASGSYDNCTYYVNNSLIGSNTTSLGTLTLNTFSIGAQIRTTIGNYWQGTKSELIFYSSDQSSNRTGISTNINDFYSIY